MENNPQKLSFDEKQQLITSLIGPAIMGAAIALAIISVSAVQGDRYKDLLNFATAVFSAGAAATNTNRKQIGPIDADIKVSEGKKHTSSDR